MKFPKTITIAGRRIKLVVRAFKGADSDKLIQINTGLNDKVALETLRHEVMEAALLISGVGFSERYEQEAVVRCMEEIFFPAWEVILKRIAFDK